MTDNTYTEDIELPEGVTASFAENTLVVKSGKNDMTMVIADPLLKVAVEGKSVLVSVARLRQKEKKVLKTTASHIQNMIKGVTKGHHYELKICSGHFPMSVAVANNELVIKNFIGEKVPRRLKLRPGAEVKVEGDIITVQSVSKNLAGQTAAEIEQLTRRPGFDERVFQDGIYITKKSRKLE